MFQALSKRQTCSAAAGGQEEQYRSTQCELPVIFIWARHLFLYCRADYESQQNFVEM